MTQRLRIERLVAGGDGLARADDGRIVFVRGGLPGEVVDVACEVDKQDFSLARVTEVVEASADRREPPCPHRVGGCGGCTWMHLAPPAQLEAKVGIVAESLRRVGRFESARVDDVVTAGSAVAPEAYRTTIRLAADGDGALGYRAESSSTIVPIAECGIAHPRLADLAAAISARPGAEVTLRTSIETGACTALPEPRHRLRGLPSGVHAGPYAWLTERVDAAVLRVSAASFFQSGPAAAALLADAVRRAIGSGGAVSGPAVDGYGGVGLFAATALRDVVDVTVVESSPAACRDARHNLASRTAGRPATVVEGRFEDWTADRRPELIVVDPARAGLGRRGVAAIAGAGPQRVVLVSCDAVALARDARLLVDAGFLLENVEVLDPFPQTHHVEAVAGFRRDGRGVP